MNGTPILLVGGKKESGKSTVANVCAEKFGGAVVSFAAPMKRFAAALGCPVENLWGSSAKRDEVIPTPEFFKEMPGVESWGGWKHSQQFLDAFDTHLAPVFGGVGIPNGSMGIVAKWVRAEWLWLNDNGGILGAEKRPFTCRHVLQTLGTECGRSIIPDCWGNYGVDTALKLLTGEFNYTQLDGLMKRPCRPPSMVVIDDCRFPNELVIGKVKGAKGLLVERPRTDSKAGGHASETSLDLIPANWWDTSVRNDGTLKDLQSALGHKLNALGFTSGLQNSI